ncbi:unnamed protein product [Closterium sp. NIES-64]|nr:unnamed protein product [Closterium sp. NIES-64]
MRVSAPPHAPEAPLLQQYMDVTAGSLDAYRNVMQRHGYNIAETQREMGTAGDGDSGRWGQREMGTAGDGDSGRWEKGEMGQRVMGKGRDETEGHGDRERWDRGRGGQQEMGQRTEWDVKTEMDVRTEWGDQRVGCNDRMGCDDRVGCEYIVGRAQRGVHRAVALPARDVRTGERSAVYARAVPSHHGSPAFSCVEYGAVDTEHLYGKLVLLMRARRSADGQGGVLQEVAYIKPWKECGVDQLTGCVKLEEVEGADACVVVPIAHIRRVVHVVQSFDRHEVWLLNKWAAGLRRGGV